VIILCEEAWLDLEEKPIPLQGSKDFPQPIRLFWPLEDPLRAQVLGEEAHLDEFREARDELHYLVNRLSTASDETLNERLSFLALLQSIADENHGLSTD